MEGREEGILKGREGGNGGGMREKRQIHLGPSLRQIPLAFIKFT